MTNKIVLDASAVLALMHREPGESIVAEYLQRSETAISIVNVAEILSKQQDIEIPPSESLPLLELLGIQFFDFDQAAAMQAAEFRKNTKAYGLSLGDRACLALGKRLDCPVLTTDRIWSQLNLDIEIILIR
jgi:ribonuclease VapC